MTDERSGPAYPLSPGFRLEKETSMTMHHVSCWGVVAAVCLVAGAAMTEAQSVPRTPDGKPDFSGIWGGGGGGGNAANPIDAQGNFSQISVGRPCHPGQECGPAVNAERDPGMEKRLDRNKPQYKPQYWERVQYLDYNGNYEDLSGHCYPLGLPRQGLPAEIVQLEDKIIFLYAQNSRWRIIPTDNRPHDPVRSQDVLWYGDSVGKWEGDTLVIDSLGFSADSWLGFSGYLHSTGMRVVERLRREGNTLIYDVTVHDPEVLEEPYVLPTRRANLNPDRKFILPEALPCDEKDWENMIEHTKERS
jgi:hypothetical protein